MKLLDCTLRDGGYYTAWDFSKPLVTRYLNAMEAAKVDIVELGLRNFPKDQFLGAYAYTTDNFIKSLNISHSFDIAVMVDAKTILSSGAGIKGAINALFSQKKYSPVDIVRVAAHFTELEQCKDIIAELKSLGYVVGLNMMQSGGRPNENLQDAAKLISSWDTVDVLYFADSLGNMDEQEVTRIISALKEYWSGELGIHTHNNQGKGLENSLTAIEQGVSWVDATVTGMGRGAGNTATELLTLEVEKRGYKYNSMTLWNLVLDDFKPMQTSYGWGASLLYHFAASHEIHPTYVQNLLSEERYTSEQIIQALTHLAPLKTSSYNAKLLQEGTTGNKHMQGGLVGEWDATDWCKDRDILIVGAGSSVNKYKVDIENFINTNAPLVLSVNIHNELKEQLVDGFVAIDPMRLMLEVSDYANRKKPLFTSKNSLPTELAEKLSKADIKDYGFSLCAGTISAQKNTCEIPSLLTLAYTICLASVGGAKRIWLIGFDGFDAGDERQEEMIDFFELINKSDIELQISCLTPTTYPITQGSIYAPI